jgi:[glutamine synthetase] adenylyltransferase / [glutamine synthetase]-adenylyl-L-tyrosine phosphorylase
VRPLAEQLSPCGPTVDGAAAERVRDALTQAAAQSGWTRLLEGSWAALAPVVGASPYLAGLIRLAPDTLRRLLEDDPDLRLNSLIDAATGCVESGSPEAGERRLRELKKELHLLTALCDLSLVWDWQAVTKALSRFADAALGAATSLAAGEAFGQRQTTRLGVGEEGPLPGLFCIAMGKLGAFELNYSSDVDISFFYEPSALPLAPGVEAGAFATRFAERVAGILQKRTVDGYVFRVDLRLRPDPSSTPAAVSVPAAFNYYESVGQNWERAAFIKARAVAGDFRAGRSFLDELQPFIWRRNLDFAAIADIHSIKRQIHVHKVDDRLTARGADLKLGRGGIREIEFYVQTQQLILGGRHKALRSAETLAALEALAEAGHVGRDAADEMAQAYRTLRGLEHRTQMVGDEQTHRLPESDTDRRRVAALAGYQDLRRFDAAVGKVLRGVNRLYGELFAGEETLASRFGSLVFTGIDDDPETITTLRRMGFHEPVKVSETIRSWHHGQIAATRTERGRELFTRLAPRLLEAAQATGAPNAAFRRFADFFSTLPAGVQVQSLFLAQPRLFELVVRIMAIAPEFARALARRPEALDALLDPAFFGPLEVPHDLSSAIVRAGGFEAAMDLARRRHRESAFRIGVQVLAGVASAEAAGMAFAELADGLICGLADVSLREVEGTAGRFPGEGAVIALGKCGSREMSARSDLDLMTLYRPSRPGVISATKGWSAETFYARFTQRLVAALSAPTAEGTLYEVDLRLRPSGTHGPVAVSAAALESYYAGSAETWEYLALTRGRVVWATSEAFAGEAAGAIEGVLRRPRDRAATGRDVLEMRALMAAERPPMGFWDMKLVEGGLVDIEFCAQFLQLVDAANGGPLLQNTGEALGAQTARTTVHAPALEALGAAWRLQQNLSQLLKIALEENADPSNEPAALRGLLAKAGGVRRFPDLRNRLQKRRDAAREAFETLISP